MGSPTPPPSSPSKRVCTDAVRTWPTEATTGSLRAHDANFGQNCIDHNIYPPVYKSPDGNRPPKPANFADLRQALKVPRRSLSPSVVPNTAFEDFRDMNAIRPGGAVMSSLIPLVASDADMPNEGNLPFTNLNSMTGNTTINPEPDFFDGADPGAVDKKVKEDLDNVIIPNKNPGIPVAPNFFLEAKRPGATMEVAVWQAVLDGAHGALAMHALQNYLTDEPIYDGNAYAFSSTMLHGYLDLYAHHLTAPAKPGQRPGYCTTLLKGYALLDDEVYPEGRAAFRNLRAVAKESRDRFIEMANARARSLGKGDTVANGNPEHGEGSSPRPL